MEITPSVGSKIANRKLHEDRLKNLEKARIRKDGMVIWLRPEA